VPTCADTASAGSHAEARLTAELTSVVSRARRRALRAGDAQIDTAHLLHSLLEADPQARAALGADHRVARVLGYLVQRSIGYGLRWQSTVKDAGSVPVARNRAMTGWSPQAVAAMVRALDRAARRGAARIAGLDPLAALLYDPDCRAVEVLDRAGVDTRPLAGQLD
jgi:ATP-dependent Clp protease ATP-binding subunit ClpA